jgi:hypothetical protein
MPRAFIIRPFGKKKDANGAEVDFEAIHKALIGPALKDSGLGGGTTGQIVDAGNIREDMFALIIEADLVICDVTVHNANVFYELGIRHALRKKRSILIKGGPIADATPFDLLTDRYVPYEVNDPAKALSDLTSAIRATLASDRETDSPVFKMLPDLPEVDPDVIQALPTDFGEDVTRARAAKSPGWLRLLAGEVAGLRFQWPGLRLVAQAQWDLEDYAGARKTWDSIRANAPDDVSTNLALANILERQYRRDKRPELLEDSNLAIARVARSEKTTAEQRAEANALQARNLKTLWRLGFEGLPDLARRRETATNRTLLRTYEAYRKAYLGDLNHYWSGLAALQQGTVALELSTEEVWQDIFDNADQAVAYKGEMKRQVEALRPMVSQAIEAARGRLAPDDKDRVWVEISAADLMFLVEERPKRVVKAYMDAIPRNAPFAWNAAKGQLQLFALLGLRTELANEVITTIDAAVAPKQEEPKKEEPKKGLHMVIFAGHRVDEPGRGDPRFPAAREAEARALIREKLAQAVSGPARVRVLASAAPGSDILCHEVCRDLGADSTICMPMPPEDFARLVFGNLDAWRSRFLDLVGARPVLQLSDQAGLPRWLQGSGLDPWERGNRWVLEMAQTSGADKVTLIALWDSKSTGDGPGGTAQMVELARNAGTIDVVLIDAGQLQA